MNDADGYFQIIGRKRDTIMAGEFSVYPRDVEEVLYEHPMVKEAVVAGIPDEYRGETVKAYVVLKPGETATEEEMIAYCKEKLAAYKVPRSVVFLDDLPKSAVGKILRKDLRESLPVQAGLTYRFGREDGGGSGARSFAVTIHGRETEVLDLGGLPVF